MDEIRAGEIVNLKSGSPAMTTSHMDAVGHWVCLWFSETDQSHLCQGAFRAETLTPRLARDR